MTRAMALAMARIERAKGEAAAREWERIAAELGADQSDGIDQSASPLGARRHCAAVKRRIAAGLDGAWIVGRRHFLTQAAIAEELKALSGKKTMAPEPVEPASVADELRAELGLHVVRGGKR